MALYSTVRFEPHRYLLNEGGVTASSMLVTFNGTDAVVASVVVMCWLAVMDDVTPGGVPHVASRLARNSASRALINENGVCCFITTSSMIKFISLNEGWSSILNTPY